MSTTEKHIVSGLILLAAAYSATPSFAQDDESDLNVGKIEQSINATGALDLNTNGFGNFQAANLIRSGGDLEQTGAPIEQTINLNSNELILNQTSIASRQAANYIGAAGSATLTDVTQSVEGATNISLDQIGSHLSVQAVNAIESGATILPIDELSNAVEQISSAVGGGLIRGAVDGAVDAINPFN